MTSISIDDQAGVYDAYRRALDEADKWKQAAELLRKRLENSIGDATEATINGIRVFTYRPTGKFGQSRFAADHPDLVVKYTVVRTVEELDTKTLAAEQPDLYAAYRSRVFRNG